MTASISRSSPALTSRFPDIIKTQGQQSVKKIAKNTVEVQSVWHNFLVGTETGGQMTVVYYSVRLRKNDSIRTKGHAEMHKYYTGRKISVSLSNVSVRGEGKMERASGGRNTPYALFPPPPRAGHQWVHL
jgi:hypothetical protein